MRFLSRFIGILAVLFSLTACPGGGEPETSISDEEKAAQARRDSLIKAADTAKVSSDLYLNSSESGNLSSILDRVEKHLSEKNYAYAKDYLNKASLVDSLDKRYLNLQGRLFLMANQSKKANDLWKKCMTTYPQDVDCRVSMAELQLTLGLNREALQIANEIISIDRNRAEGFFFKGMAIRAVQESDEEAIPYFQQAVDLKNDYVEALDMLGVIYAQKKDSLALAYYQNILEIQPERSDIYFKMGVYHMEREEWNQSMGAYERAIQLNPRDADSYYNLGYVLTTIKVYDKARNSFAKAISVSPRNFKAYYGRGYAHEMLGDLTNAASDYREALGIRPKHQPSAEGLTRVKKKMSTP